MAPQRIDHTLVKGCVYTVLQEAIGRAGLGCAMFPDGIAVRVDDYTVYEPDAAVRCGEPLSNDAVEYDDPVIVVEVLPPGTQSIDTSGKLVDYFRLPALQHFLVVCVARRVIIDHCRNGHDHIATAIVASEVVLDLPGLRLDVALLFPSEF